MKGRSNVCRRTGRACMGGAFDGGDGFGIDCPMMDAEGCPERNEGEETGDETT